MLENSVALQPFPDLAGLGIALIIGNDELAAPALLELFTPLA
jgi:hypothetical protein